MISQANRIIKAGMLWCLALFLMISAQENKPVSDIVSGNNTFAFSLYAKLKTTKGNVFFSPYSISTALAMTYAGARGNTEKQMAQVMHFGKDQKAFHNAFGELQNKIIEVQKTGNVKLSVANSLWMQKGYKFLPDFLTLTEKNYDAGLNIVDYVNETEKARIEINTWVEKKTNEKILDLIPPGPPDFLTKLTRLVLTNAIYFKGNWKTKFDTTMTREMPFWINQNLSVGVKMMNLNEQKFNYYADKTIECLEMPYAGKELSMVVILPRNRTGITEVENSFNKTRFDEVCTHLRKTELNISFPKFKTTKNLFLKDTLVSLGMRDAFTNSADFSGMTGTKDLCVSAVIHKAFIDIYEEGTEAAAATAVIIKTKGGSVSRSVHFCADHPFLFFIRENSTGSILFMGRIINPTL